MKNLKSRKMFAAVVISFVIGCLTTGAVMSKAMADEVSTATTSLQESINTLEDADMQILAESMDPAIVDQTTDMLGGQANCKAFVSTYCVLDTDFAEVVIDYAR